MSDLPLRFALCFDVVLRDGERRMSCDCLDVAERASHSADFLRCVRDEGGTSRVRGATCRSVVNVPACEHVDDRLCGRARRALCAYDVQGCKVEVVTRTFSVEQVLELVT